MRNIIFAVFSLLFLAACDQPPKLQILTGAAQGTTYTIKFWTADKADSKTIAKDIEAELIRIDKLISSYRDDSAIERFNQQKIAGTTIPLDKETLELLNTSSDIYQQSNHCFDPTVKPLFRMWGFGKGRLNLPTAAEINAVKQHVGFDQLTITADGASKQNPELTVDLSAIGQGYAVTKIAELLTAQGIDHYLVEIGGEMKVAGTKPEGKPWRIGVERPVPHSQQVNEIITVTGKRPTAVMTSGTYRHFFDNRGKKYSHILDPRSGRPVEHHTAAVTVVIEDATLADAWSTALLCLGSEEGMKVANALNMPAIFYVIDDKEKIQRYPSKAVETQSDNWTIKNNVSVETK